MGIFSAVARNNRPEGLSRGAVLAL